MMSTKPSLTTFYGKPAAKAYDAAREESTSPTSTVSELGEPEVNDDVPVVGTRRRRVQTEKAASMKSSKRPYRKTSDTFWGSKKSKTLPPETDAAAITEEQRTRSSSLTSSSGSGGAGGEAMEAELTKANAGAGVDVDGDGEAEAEDVEMEEGDANEASNALGLDDMPPPALPSNSITTTASDQLTLPSSRAASEAPSNHSESSASVAATPTPATTPATVGGRRAAATARKALSADKTEKKKVGRPLGIKKKKNAKLEVVEKVVNFEVIVHNDHTLELAVSYLPTPFSLPTLHRPVSILRQMQPSSTFTSYLYSIFPPDKESGGVVSVEIKSRGKKVQQSQERRLPTGKGRRLGLVVKDGMAKWVPNA